MTNESSGRPRASALGIRYLPFLAALAIFVGLIVLAPSRQPITTTGSGLGLGSGPSQLSTNGSGGPAAGNGAAAGGGNGAGSGPATGSLTAGGQGSTSGGGVNLPGSGPNGGSANAVNGGPGGTATGTAAGLGRASQCAGYQPAPYYTGVPCLSGFRGSNGGSTTTGVTATAIRYTVWIPESNAAIDSILAQTGFSDTPDQICQSLLAFQKTIQKRFDLYGRQLVPVDGPGVHAGSKQAGSGCVYPYFYSQCSTTPPDYACARAEADVMASMKVAFVIDLSGVAPMDEELAKDQVISIDGGNASRAIADAFAPYIWSPDESDERIATLAGQYYCNELVGHAPEYAGTDVTLADKTRHVGLIYAYNPGDSTSQTAANIFLSTVHGCGDKSAQGFTYASDFSTIQTQSTNIAAQLIASHVSTVACYCDPVGLLFIMEAEQNDNYHPEQMTVGVGGIADDPVGQIYSESVPGEWSHAFGLSNFAVNELSSSYDYNRAFADGGGKGSESLLDYGNWPVFELLGQFIQQAGPVLDTADVYRGALAMPAIRATKKNVGSDFAAPDTFAAQRDVALVWYDPTLRSAYNGQAGAMCYVDGARRYDIGQLPFGEPALFSKSGPCATP